MDNHCEHDWFYVHCNAAPSYRYCENCFELQWQWHEDYPKNRNKGGSVLFIDLQGVVGEGGDEITP